MNAKHVDRAIIKCCPYCGSLNFNGPHFNDYSGDYYDPYWWIECTECPACMQVEGESPEGLIESWNKRFNVNI